MAETVIWWFGLVSLITLAPIGLFIVFSVALERACRNYPALWRALYYAAQQHMAKRRIAEQERIEREADSRA